MFCQLIAVGRLGRDPEKSDSGPCRFSIATTRTYTKDGEKVEDTEWVNVTVWGKQGESCAKFLKKGRVVQVIGHLKTSEWEKDGQKHRKTECVADRVVFLPDGGGKSRKSDDGDSPPDDSGYAPSDPGDDDVPF